MHRQTRRSSISVTLALVTVTLAATVAAATTFAFPTPGTAAKIASQVAASLKITTLPAHLSPSLSEVAVDEEANTSLHTLDGGCIVLTPKCTYGKKTSKKLVVLFGDSHAWMWLAAVNPGLVKAGYRLDLLWRVGCPAATLTVWDTETNSLDAGCDAWRTQALSLIKGLKPSLVLLAERTSDLETAAGVLVTASQVTTGLETTISTLKTKSTKVAVIGDNPSFANFVSPPACLSINPTSVQKCATPLVNPDVTFADNEAAEKVATTTEKAGFIDPTPWLCTKGSCSPIIGNMAVYFDWSHLTATYSGYLAGVMATKIKPLL